MKRKTSIGGMALLEGVMMMGPHNIAVAVRKPDGDIVLDKKELPKKKKIHSVPIVRGSILLFRQMIQGVKALMFAAEFYDIEEEGEKKPSKSEKFLEKIFGDKLKDAAIYFAVILSLFMSVGLFILLPNVIAGLFNIGSDFMYNIVEGVFRLVIFFAYLVLATTMKDIKRVWMYHGAEHKTINCYEAGEELTVENARKYRTLNPRCGTSFIFLVLVISIIVFSVVGWYGVLINILLRIVLIPLVAGLSYELLKFAGKSDHPLMKAVSAPGMFFQLLTTKEPDDQMLEVAITAFNAVRVEVPGEDEW